MRRINLELLPNTPSAKVSEKYDFIDSRKIADNMADLGYDLAEVTTPSYRTPDGAWGTHQLDFRPNGWQDKAVESERILFVNSYDGTRRAEIISGLIRFACLNGIVTGDNIERAKFLHLGGDTETELLEHIDTVNKGFQNTWDKIESYKSLRLDDQIYMEMAREALELRYPDPDSRLDIQPATILMPRRQEDTGTDLYSAFNVLQENIIKGGVPGRDKDGKVRLNSPLSSIERNNGLNANLWALMDKFAAFA